MKKQDFISIINDYLYINNSEMVSKKIKLDKYTICINLKLNILCIRVLNNETNNNIDLGAKKYKSYIEPIMNVSSEYLNKGRNHIFTLDESKLNTTENTTTNNTNKNVDYELTYDLNGYEFTKRFISEMTMNSFIRAIQNETFVKKEVKEVPKEKITNDTTKKTILKNIDIDKLNSLVENYDKIMELLNTTNNTTTNTTYKKIDLSTKNTKVTSIRLNKDIHEKIKVRADEEDINIGELINKALYEYLNKSK